MRRIVKKYPRIPSHLGILDQCHSPWVSYSLSMRGRPSHGEHSISLCVSCLCCMTNCHKLSILKQHTFMISKCLWPRVWVLLSWILSLGSQSCNQGVVQEWVLIRGSGGEGSTSSWASTKSVHGLPVLILITQCTISLRLRSRL